MMIKSQSLRRARCSNEFRLAPSCLLKVPQTWKPWEVEKQSWALSGAISFFMLYSSEGSLGMAPSSLTPRKEPASWPAGPLALTGPGDNRCGPSHRDPCRGSLKLHGRFNNRLLPPAGHWEKVLSGGTRSVR